jgi:polyisoprenoid-binding protein YceI
MKLYQTITVFGLGAIILAFSPAKKEETYTIKPEASNIEWFAEKVTGKHNGTVALKSGKIGLEDGMLTSGNFVVDMTSIKVTDLEGEYATKLEGHLKSPDFFGVESHPTASFEITDVILENEDKFNTRIKGNLTIKDISHPIDFPAQIEVKNGNFAAYGKMVIDRAKYDVRYGSGSFFDDLGDKTIYDEFTMKVSIGAQL